MSGEEFGVRPEAVDLADGVPVGRRKARLVGRVPCRVGEALVGEEHLGARVGDDPGDLGGDEVVVDRDQVEPGLAGGEVRGEELGAVGQDDGEGVTAFQSGRAQAVHELVGGGVQAARGPGRTVGGGEDRA